MQNDSPKYFLNKTVSAVSFNLFDSPIVFTNIHKHIQFNTITYKQKGKRVEPQILKLIYATPLIAVT